MNFLVDNAFLIVIAFVSGAMLFWPLIQRRAAGGNFVTTLEATRLINDRSPLVIDVREPAEFSAGHLNGARNVPLGQLASRIGELAKAKDKPILLVCQSGNRSARAAALLRKEGYSEVFNLDGGVAAWAQANLPLSR